MTHRHRLIARALLLALVLIPAGVGAKDKGRLPLRLTLSNARRVTPSGHLLQTPKSRILVDPGMNQGRGEQDKMLVDAKQLSAIVLTHEHLDHVGMLPAWVKAGFKGKIVGTEAALAAAEHLLRDSASVMRNNARRKKSWLRKKGKPFEHIQAPYSKGDVSATLELFRPVKPNQRVTLGPDTTGRFELTGHVVGAASALLEVTGDDGTKRRVLFSGDLGNTNNALHRKPDPIKGADYVVEEYTYGGRAARQPAKDPVRQLADAQALAQRRGGRLIIAAFALDRTQQLLYLLKKLRLEDKAARAMDVYLDGPLANKMTEVYRRFPHYLASELRDFERQHGDPFSFEGLHLVGKGEESLGLIDRGQPAVIIAGSGMASGGRIMNHLERALPNPNDVVLFTGYAAPGTLAHTLKAGKKKVRLHGKNLEVKATILNLEGLSGHRDHEQLVQWARENAAEARALIPNHGNGKNLEAFSKALEAAGIKVRLPEGDVIELD